MNGELRAVSRALFRHIAMIVLFSFFRSNSILDKKIKCEEGKKELKIAKLLETAPETRVRRMRQMKAVKSSKKIPCHFANILNGTCRRWKEASGMENESSLF